MPLRACLRLMWRHQVPAVLALEEMGVMVQTQQQIPEEVEEEEEEVGSPTLAETAAPVP